MWLLLLLNLSFADCELPFPLQVKDKVVAACLKAERTQNVGHLLFVEMPRAVFSADKHSSSVQYFANTKETRQRLCTIFKKKRQMSNYSLEDKSGGGIAYSRTGFTYDKNASTLKMLACTVL
jgi:hypothetical protein